MRTAVPRDVEGRAEGGRGAARAEGERRGIVSETVMVRGEWRR
jgi:hypothetical protein